MPPTGLSLDPLSFRSPWKLDDARDPSHSRPQVGGGKSPETGDFVGINVKVSSLDPTDPDAMGTILFDTKATGRPVAFKFLISRGGVVVKGLEQGVADMRRGGVRRIDIPAPLAFGEAGVVLPNGVEVAPGAALRYEVSLEEVTPAYF